MNRKLWLAAAAASLTACASSGDLSAGDFYRCEHGIEFNVRFVDDSAVLKGARGNEVLFRDAGGQGPQQAAYRGPTLRAEFGLGANGREAQLNYPMLPLSARCVQD